MFFVKNSSSCLLLFLCSEIFTLKLNLWPKPGLTYAVSIVNCFIIIIIIIIIKYLLLISSVMQCIVTFYESLNKWNFLKICLHYTYPIEFCIICFWTVYPFSSLFLKARYLNNYLS